MSKLINDHNVFIDSGASSVIHSGPGKIHSIYVCSTAAAGTVVTFYDNTAAAGNTLLTIMAGPLTPFFIMLGPIYSIPFAVGLAVSNGANVKTKLVCEW